MTIGHKYDAGKRRWSLLPWEAIDVVIMVLEYGAKKYGDSNWRHVENARERYFDAAMRHMAAHGRGEVLDPESGLPALAHAACSILFVLCLPSCDAQQKQS